TLAGGRSRGIEHQEHARAAAEEDVAPLHPPHRFQSQDVHVERLRRCQVGGVYAGFEDLAGAHLHRLGYSLKISMRTAPAASMRPRYIPLVLKGQAQFPCRSMAITPPSPFCATSWRMTMESAAWVSGRRPYSIS